VGKQFERSTKTYENFCLRWLLASPCCPHCLSSLRGPHFCVSFSLFRMGPRLRAQGSRLELFPCHTIENAQLALHFVRSSSELVPATVEYHGSGMPNVPLKTEDRRNACALEARGAPMDPVARESIS
jgi:hypothetical protein